MIRPTITPRSERPFSRLDEVLIQMINAHAGKPCPTRKDVMQWTGMPRRRIWTYLYGMRDRGLIEIEECKQAPPPAGALGEPKRRRMRAEGGEWTLYTARRPACFSKPLEPAV